MTQPADRAARRAGVPDLVDRLAALPGTDLSNLVLAALAARPRSPADLTRQLADDPFVAPSTADARAMAALDARLLAAIPDRFEVIELSPLAPGGTCAALGPVAPYHVLPALRGTEVAADPTDMMAVITAARRDPVVRLATSQRVVRAQRLTPEQRATGFSQHFRLLALTTSGRDPGGRTFARDATLDHLRVLLDLLRGEGATGLRVTLAADAAHAPVADAIAAALDVPVDRDDARLTRSSYYRGLAFKLWVGGPGGDAPLGDGGLVDWLAKLRSDRKQRFAIAALGTELVVKRRAPVEPTGAGG